MEIFLGVKTFHDLTLALSLHLTFLKNLCVGRNNIYLHVPSVC